MAEPQEVNPSGRCGCESQSQWDPAPSSQTEPPPLSRQEEKVPPPIPKKPSRGRGVPVKERSLDSVDRQRQEARKRLLAAKRAASFRHSSATESADSIEIYIPEAQTRL